MTILQAAEDYIRMGLAPLPIPYMSKEPILKDWPSFRTDLENVQKHFNGAKQNIGVLQGLPSNGCADVDLDSRAANIGAAYLLLPTRRFGHGESPRSHWIYMAPGLSEIEATAVRNFYDLDGTKLLELRSGGSGRAAQTVFPPSVHVSGEPIIWADRRTLAVVDPKDLRLRVSLLAVACLIGTRFPAGGRHDLCRYVGGFLGRCHVPEELIAATVEAAGRISGQADLDFKDMRRTAIDGSRADKPAGFPTMARGFGEDVAKKIAEWLGYEGARAEDETRGQESFELPPEPDRASLLLSAWLDRDIPLRDYLLGGVMCTTSRWFIYGETGIGKTLFSMEFTAAMAAAATFLRWPGQRRARVMYIDGEMPVETFKERMELIKERHGRDLVFYGYNREDLGDGGLPPLNTPLGQAWLWREIDAIKPDIIVFDSIMCLLTGAMKDEETWAPMKPLVCKLSARRIAQIWLNHANDIGKSYGDKTREWEMDTVAKLSKVEGDDGAIQFEFTKARLRNPRNAEQFEPVIFRPADGWRFDAAPKRQSGAKEPSMAWIIRTEFMEAYDRLANGVTKTPGFDGKPVIKVATVAITAELKTRGYLPLDENGSITHPASQMLSMAKAQLLKSRRIVENDNMIWRI